MVTYFGLIYFFSMCFGISICFSEPIFYDEPMTYATFDEGTYDGLSSALMFLGILACFWGSGAFSMTL
jgi:hypothetical protein